MSEHERPWQVLGRETIYTSEWINLHRDDVRLPDGSVIQGHHVLDFPRLVVVVVPIGEDGRILMIEHYRFITDTTGWEVPAGGTDFSTEEVALAAMRELREETGYEAEQLDLIGQFYPSNGISNQTAYVYAGRGLRKVGEVEDTNEVQRMAWFSQAEVRQLIATNQVQDGISLTALLWFLFEQSNR